MVGQNSLQTKVGIHFISKGGFNMDFITANEAKEQSYRNIEQKIKKEIADAIEKGYFKCSINSNKLSDSIIDKFKDLGYNIKEVQGNSYNYNFTYIISW